MENCTFCQGKLEFLSIYAHCKECGSIFINVADTWLEYPVIAPMRQTVERLLGFIPVETVEEKRKTFPRRSE